MSAPRDRHTTALADRYQIERELSCCGLAIVYVARDLHRDTNAAVKVLEPELAAAGVALA